MDFSPENLRKNIIKMASYKAGHLACAFSLVEIVSAFFGKQLFRYDPRDPNWPDRDILALSKGHGAMALYSCFYELGWITDEHLDNYFCDGSDLFGLIEDVTPGAEISGGTLGHGLPVAVGWALGLKRQNSTRRVFCIVGDGELNEGSMWEAVLFAGHHRLNNLTIIVDANEYQAMGRTQEILDMEPLTRKFDAFKLASYECHGHSVDKICESIIACKGSDMPSVLIARTIKGAGVDFMEKNNLWHYRRLEPNQIEDALQQIRRGRVPGES